MGTHLPLPKKGPEPPIFGPCLLWTNGWVDQDATWYGGRHRPRRRCVRWGPSSPSQQGAQPPVFGPCLLWSNGWMDEDPTWYGNRPRPWPHGIRQGPSSTREDGTAAPLFGGCLLWPRSPTWATADLLLTLDAKTLTLVCTSGTCYRYVLLLSNSATANDPDWSWWLFQLFIPF